ncbi:MAG TPA: hypothetical protein VK670_12925 [Silvibacterium sp.]|nr:hypothetical protein [Silvibacterium sp.]
MLSTLLLRSPNGIRNLSGTIGNALVHVRQRFKSNGQNFGAEFAFDLLKDERHVDPVDVSWNVVVPQETTRQFSSIFIKRWHCCLSPFGVAEINEGSDAIPQGGIKARENA